MKIKSCVLISAILIGILGGLFFYRHSSSKELKLYWFIPDGMRADTTVFNIFEWAQKGELPNIKKMMGQGSYGYSIPVFPSHTPTNFASLLTGAYPKSHGVADGPMHTEGNPLNRVSVGGFNSAAKKIAPLWVTLEKEYNKKVVLLSIPGSTPPELSKGITIRGRWGGWGPDFHATNFERESSEGAKAGRKVRLFFFGAKLTQYLKPLEPENWQNPPPSFSMPKELILDNYGQKVYAYIYDSTDDENMNYDRICFSFDKKIIFADLRKGDWSNWLPILLKWKSQEQEIPIETNFKIKIIKLEPEGFFRIRFLYNVLNPYIVYPQYIAHEINKAVGPMVDFVDNFPGQLNIYPEDKGTFYEEAMMTLDWHRKAAKFIISQYEPDIFINDTYTPNQVLESKWWMYALDPNSQRYTSISEVERKQLWTEVKEVYKRLDLIVGEMMKKADKDTLVILSSDHGLVPLNYFVRLNNLFAEKGWLKFTIDTATGEPIIDWENSKVIYLKMDNVYIHPQGLGGNWERGSGEEYEELRTEVIKTLKELEDPETHKKPVSAIHRWEDVAEYLHLPSDRVGDIVIANEAGFGWNEEMTEDRLIFEMAHEKSGYKQAILANNIEGMWTPFIVMGPGVKKGYAIKDPIRIIDQYPTILTLMKKKIPETSEGRVVSEIFD